MDPSGGAVALHVIQLSPERYRGSILVLTPPDAFSENINLTHTADFGGNTAEVWGRPVGIAVAKDGSLLIHQSATNRILKVTPKEPAVR